MKSIVVVVLTSVALITGCSLIRPNPVPPEPDLVGVKAQDAARASQVERLPDGTRRFTPLVAANKAVEAARAQAGVDKYASQSLAQAEDALGKAQSAWQALADKDSQSPDNLAVIADDAHSAQRLAEIAHYTAVREANLNTLASISRQVQARERAQQQARRQRAAPSGSKRFGRRVIPGPLGEIDFQAGTPRLTAQSRQVVAKLAKLLKQRSEFGVAILGHTDNTGPGDASLKRFVNANPGLEDQFPARSDKVRAFNLALSSARARAVANLLVDKGIPADRIGARGFGDRRPVASNDTAKGRRANRRVEAVLIARPDDNDAAAQGGGGS